MDMQTSHTAGNGKIMLVGIGPGDAGNMTARAREAIREADTIIGYVTYIKLVADLIEGKEIVRKSMTEELDRAIEALERARQGKKVALCHRAMPVSMAWPARPSRCCCRPAGYRQSSARTAATRTASRSRSFPVPLPSTPAPRW